MNILIVDDTPDNVLLLKSILLQAGFTELLSAESAAQAYEILKVENSEEPSSVDLILMDIMMPGISGIDACRKIKSKALLADIPVIMITAQTDMESLENAFNAGAMDYIMKPIRRTDLLARVRSALSLKKAVDERKLNERNLAARNAELEKAMSEIKVLRGFIPICAHCKKIRNLEGCWQQLEAYFHEHSDVKFSHGICERCMAVNYPEYQRGINKT